MHLFSTFYIFLAFCSRFWSRMFDSLQKLSLQEINEYSKPPIEQNFFWGVASTTRWILIEEYNYTLSMCLPDGITLSLMVDPIFRWYGPNSHKTRIDESRMKVFKNGQLEIKRPQQEDTGYYICEVTSKTESDLRVTYEKTFAVFLYPQMILIRYYFVRSIDCNENSNIVFLDLAIKTFCNGETNCLFSFRIDSCIMNSENFFETRFTVSQNLPDLFFNDLPKKCGVVCKRNKTVDIFYESSKSKANTFEQNLKWLYKSDINDYFYVDEKTKSFILPICPEGYSVYNGYVCIPCDKGHSRRANNETSTCEICGPFSYQDKVGQSDCVTCDLFKLSAKYGATDILDCKYFFTSWIAMLIILPSVMIIVFVTIALFVFLQMSGFFTAIKIIKIFKKRLGDRITQSK